MKLKSNQATLCPLCQRGNYCGMMNPTGANDCWCFKETFPKAMLDSLPPNREKICICKNCLTEFKS